MIAPSWLLLAVLGPLAQVPAVDEDRVVAAIEEGKNAILEQIRNYHEIEYHPTNNRQQRSKVRGTVVRDVGATIEFRTTSGRELKIKRNSIVSWIRAGYVRAERQPPFNGGPSALAALALLMAGTETAHPAMASLLEALAEDDDRGAGTYVHSLRAGVWAALLERPIGKKRRLKYRRLLGQDTRWLVTAIRSGGGFGYSAASSHGWDNSNSQFACLGLWSGAVAKVEVANRIWQAVAEHWLRMQSPTGGWSYRGGSTGPTPSMTVAGCNSLYIVLDRYYAHADRPYARFKGARSSKAARRQMERLYDAIHGGDTFLKVNPPNVVQFDGYELFGLERLGITSGQAVIGGLDWYRRYVGRVARRRWGGNLIADAFALIFLVHGRAPILFQKLEHGDRPDDWNYYHRDLYSLARYLTRSFERLHRWQRIPTDATLFEMQDAPFLYVAGRGTLSLPDDTLATIRRYIDRGGTVFLHADRADKEFTRTAAAVFERMFRDLDYRFKPLKESHPVFGCHFDCRPEESKLRVPLRAIADGPRVLVYLCPVDIAGAWHQERQAKFEDLFQLMANVRVYSAPPHGELPSRLRTDPLVGRAAPFQGRLSLRRLPHRADWNAHPSAWRRFTRGLRHRAGIDLIVDADNRLPDTAELEPFDIVHLTVRRALQLDKEMLGVLRSYVEDGGLLLIDAADGQPQGIAAVRRLVDALDIGRKGVLSAGHPVARGGVPGGRSLVNLETTKAGSSLRHGAAPPPILTRSIDDRVAVIACPFDLIAGIDGHFIWKRVGYRRASTARIIDNILLWRLAQTARLPRATPPDRSDRP